MNIDAFAAKNIKLQKKVTEHQEKVSEILETPIPADGEELNRLSWAIYRLKNDHQTTEIQHKLLIAKDADIAKGWEDETEEYNDSDMMSEEDLVEYEVLEAI